MHVNILWRCTCLLSLLLYWIYGRYAWDARILHARCSALLRAVKRQLSFRAGKWTAVEVPSYPWCFVCQFHIYMWIYIYDTSSICIIFTAALYQLTSLITLIDNFSLGFTGTLCAENINNCDPDPCHHGECQDGIDSYTCICNPGYMGAICSEQIDECHSNPCLHQGRCIDLVNGYQCNCLLGTSGT